MPKIITETELAALVADLICDPASRGEGMDRDRYTRFLRDIAQTVANHCGGEVTCIRPGDAHPDRVTDARLIGIDKGNLDYHWQLHIAPNECLPSPGDGVWGKARRLI